MGPLVGLTGVLPPPVAEPLAGVFLRPELARALRVTADTGVLGPAVPLVADTDRGVLKQRAHISKKKKNMNA